MCEREILKWVYICLIVVVLKYSFVSSGPAVPLFEKPYYEKIFSALKPNGILCYQGM